MDKQTLQFYRDNHNALLTRYRLVTDGVDRYFSQAFTPGSKVLDIGAGCGRDLAHLLHLGYDAYGVDACREFVENAIIAYPEIKDKIAVESLPDLKSITSASYEGILCSSVLMHLAEEHLFDAVFNIKRLLKINGRLLISIPHADTTICPDTKRDPNGRLFNSLTPENYQLVFERLGFRLISRWDNDDALGRNHRQWATLLFSLEDHEKGSLDQIEAILNKDKKDATYKLALFRALADIAMSNYNSALWLPAGKVALPLRNISEKWLEYYWPIIESEKFIPQKRGEKPDGVNIAFRKLLSQFTQSYREAGGLSAYSIDYRNNALIGDQKKLCKTLLSKLDNTIKVGPVTFSGGKNSDIFHYDKQTKSVVMNADLWRELSIMGPWIQDAIILRWAELTAVISNGELRPSTVIDCLLTVPIEKRDTGAARKLYENLMDKKCVWSDREIAKDFAVDHAIPFALWKNNDLWNLLPTDAKVNGHKSDKLPERQLIHERKDAIVHYWQEMRQTYQTRFDFEAAKFAGEKAFLQNNWQNKLFASFAEAIEITAVRRGVDRWKPTG